MTTDVTVNSVASDPNDDTDVCMYLFGGWSGQVWLAIEFKKIRLCLVSKFFLRFSVTSNIWMNVWRIKCRRKKLITQFDRKPRDESFEPN
jgi:hypothetical protein